MRRRQCTATAAVAVRDLSPVRDREDWCHVRYTNGLTPQQRRPSGAKAAAAVERRSKPKCLKTQVPYCPVRHEGDTCCRRTIRSEIRAAHRVRLRTIPASAEDSRGSGAPGVYLFELSDANLATYSPTQ